MGRIFCPSEERGNAGWDGRKRSRKWKEEREQPGIAWTEGNMIEKKDSEDEEEWPPNGCVWRDQRDEESADDLRKGDESWKRSFEKLPTITHHFVRTPSLIVFLSEAHLRKESGNGPPLLFPPHSEQLPGVWTVEME